MLKRIIFVVLVLASFMAACALPAYYGEGGFMESGDDIPGLLFLIFGPLCGEVIGISWLGNLCFLVGIVLILRKKARCAIAFGCLAFLLSLLTGLDFAFYSTARFQIELRIALAIGVDRARELRTGYFVWVATHWHLFFGAVTFYVWERYAARSRS